MRVILARFRIFMLWLCTGGCSFGAEGGKLADGKLLATSFNHRFNLSIEFYGSWVGPDSAPRERWVVARIVSKDGKTGQSIQFTPDDSQTLRDSFGYFADVWSPDFEYLVLPLGRYEGFAVFQAGKVMEELRQQAQEKLQIKLTTKDSPLLWHQFLGWQRDHVLRFSAGLSGTAVEFRYDPEAKRVYGLTNTFASFRALTPTGEIPVQPLQN